MTMRNTKVLSLLKKHPEGLDLGGIQQALEVKHRDRAKLLEELKEMQGAGLVRFLRKRYFLPAESGLIRGRFVTTRRGFGFVCRADKSGEDIFVPARHAEGVIQGDEVEVLVHEKGRFGKPEGRIVRVLARERTSIMGVYAERAGAPFLQAFDSPSPEDIALKSKGKGRPRPGMIVEVDRKTLAVSRVYGMPDDPGVDAEVIIRRFGLARSFGEETLRESEAVPAELTDRDLEGRRDFRDWASVTIDGEKAQDFDDAVSIRRLEGGGFRLGVHIADVSHYVHPGTALDAEAYARATSVYFPGLTLPMLPEKLSNNLCSLRPAVPRLTVSVLMDIDATGRVVRSEFTPSVIQTAERMTYTSVFKIFEGDREEGRRHARLVPDLLVMREAAALLRARRVAEGSLDFDLVEPELIYEEGKLMAVAAAERNDAHRLIEEFMVAANVAVASFLTAKGVPTIYRVHPVPALADLEKLRDILAHLGYALPPADKVRSKDLARVLDKAKGKPEEKFVGIQVLRAMKIATYDAENVGHYGLAKKDYTHFTSPIRRYPDLIVHRILKEYLACGAVPALSLEEAARHSSERERNADEAEKALVEWRIFRFLKDRLGDEFDGIVVDVSKAGLVVELEDYFVDGLVPFSALREEFAPAKGRKKGRGRHFPKSRAPRVRFELGDRLRVALVACDPILERMTLMPADGREEAL